MQLRHLLTDVNTSFEFAMIIFWCIIGHESSLGVLGRASLDTPSVEDSNSDLTLTRQRDLLPLPLPCLLQVEATFLSANISQAELVNAEVTLWLWLVILSLNWEYCGGLQHSNGLFRGMPSATQKAAMIGLTGDVRRYCNRAPESVERRDWQSELKVARGCSNSYDALDESCAACDVVFAEILPGLPSASVAASVDARSLCDNEVLVFIDNPDDAVLPESLWPVTLPAARVQGDRSEIILLVQHLVGVGMMRAIGPEECFYVRGKVLVNGLFAVPKKGAVPDGLKRIWRLIANLKRSNSLLRMLRSSLGTLCGSAAWTAIHLENGDVLLWSSDDQSGAYHVFKMPRGWHKFFVINIWILWKEIGVDRDGGSYYCLCTLPMGFNSAVSIFQYMHRNMGFRPYPHGAGFPACWEWRRDAKLPLNPFSQFKGWIQYYLDDFDSPCIVPNDVAISELGKINALQQRQREAYAFSGVSTAAHKAVLQQTHVVRMGAELDGVDGYVGVEVKTILQTVSLALWLLGSLHRPLLWMQIVMGRLVRILEFRRPIFGALFHIWKSFQPGTKWFCWSRLSESELLCVCSLMPLALSDLRTEADGMVYSTDASMSGGGVCEST